MSTLFDSFNGQVALFDSFDGKVTLIDEFNSNIESDEVDVLGVVILNPISAMVVDSFHEAIAEVLPLNANNKKIIWASTDTSILWISQMPNETNKAKITAVKDGTATVMASADGNHNAHDSFSITVGSAPQHVSVLITNKPNSIKLGESIQLEALIYADPIIDAAILWSVSAPEVVGVSATGLLFARGKGSAIIYASVDRHDDVRDSFYIIVDEKISPKSLEITNKIFSIVKNNSHQFIVSIFPTSTTDTRMVWSSSNEHVAVVSSAGFLTAMATGNVAIKCQSAENESVHDIVKIEVYDSITGITIAPKPSQLNAGAVVQLGVSIDGAGESPPVVIWKTSNSLTGIIDQSGLLRIREAQ